MTFKQAKELTKGSPGQDFTSEEEHFLTVLFTQNHAKRPVFITHFPSELSPFYMKTSNGTAHNFDLLFPSVGELLGGSEREDDASLLAQRMSGTPNLE